MNTFHPLKRMLKLYFVLGSVQCPYDPAYLLEQAIQGGVTLFQYREKGSGARSGSERLRLAKELQAVCRRHRIPFIVNDDVDLALEINADGIHVGQEDTPLKDIRPLFRRKILGVSASTVQEALDAEQEGADYLGVGPVYGTQTKEDARAAIGTERIRDIAKAVSIPVVGIGGIHLQNASRVIRSGAAGIAVISAISQSQNAYMSARLLRNTVDRTFRPRLLLHQ